MTSDASEKGLKNLIVASMTGRSQFLSGSGLAHEPEPYLGLSNCVLGDLKLTLPGEGRQ